MAVETKNTKYFYPPRPGNGAGTFSDNIVGLQTVEGGGLTQGNFEFTTGVTEKVNRTFNVGAFSEPMSLDMMGIRFSLKVEEYLQHNLEFILIMIFLRFLTFQCMVHLSKRFSVSITRIINYFPASLDVMFNNNDYVQQVILLTILVYDAQNDETYFKVNVDRIKNPFDIDYSISAATNLSIREITVSPYRNLI
jgi:hypothetical protein